MAIEQKNYLNEKFGLFIPEVNLKEEKCEIEIRYGIKKKIEIYTLTFINGKLEITDKTENNILFNKIIKKGGINELINYIRKELIQERRKVYNFFCNPLINIQGRIWKASETKEIRKLMDIIEYKNNKIKINSENYKIKKLIEPNSEMIIMIKKLENTIDNYNKAIDFIVFSKDIEIEYKRKERKKNKFFNI